MPINRLSNIDRMTESAILQACIYSQWGKFQPQQQQVDGCNAQSPQMLNFLFLQTMDTGAGRTADIMLSFHLPRLHSGLRRAKSKSHSLFG